MQASHAKTAITRQAFSQLDDGTRVDLYTLGNDRMEVRVATYGGIIVSLRAPDRQGSFDDVVLGYDSLSQYVANNPYFGAIIGRYANRIAHGRFTLQGETCSLPKNHGDHSLHGGMRGFDKVVWKAEPIEAGIELSHISKDGDQGYPGTLNATVRYTLSSDALCIESSATTDRATVVNLTNHSYFNLRGHGKETILQHRLKIHASHFTPVDSTLIPTGELRSVDGTPFDFRTSTAVGERIGMADDQLLKGNGYDHNWVLDKPEGETAEAAELYEPITGRVLQVRTTEPGIQFYSGNFLDGTITGKQSRVYGKRSGLCLETQHFPDSPNHLNFPSTELKPGERYRTVTVFKFGVRMAETR